MQAIGDFVALIDELRDLVTVGHAPSAILEAVLARTGYLAELEASADPQDEGRVENLRELVAVAREFEEAAPEGGLAEFLERVSLVADADEIPDDDGTGGVVTLMTLHTAKGLEFPVVFLTGLEDGVFPHHALAGRPEGAGGGAPARLRRHHPRASGSTSAARSAGLRGAPRRTTRPRGSWTSCRTSSSTGAGPPRRCRS